MLGCLKVDEPKKAVAKIDEVVTEEAKVKPENVELEGEKEMIKDDIVNEAVTEECKFESVDAFKRHIDKVNAEAGEVKRLLGDEKFYMDALINAAETLAKMSETLCEEAQIFADDFVKLESRHENEKAKLLEKLDEIQKNQPKKTPELFYNVDNKVVVSSQELAELKSEYAGKLKHIIPVRFALCVTDEKEGNMIMAEMSSVSKDVKMVNKKTARLMSKKQFDKQKLIASKHDKFAKIKKLVLFLENNTQAEMIIN